MCFEFIPHYITELIFYFSRQPKLIPPHWATRWRQPEVQVGVVAAALYLQPVALSLPTMSCS